MRVFVRLIPYLVVSASIHYGASTWVAGVVIALISLLNRCNCLLFTPQCCPAQAIHVSWDFNSPFVMFQFRGRAFFGNDARVACINSSEIG